MYFIIGASFIRSPLSIQNCNSLSRSPHTTPIRPTSPDLLSPVSRHFFLATCLTSSQRATLKHSLQKGYTPSNETPRLWEMLGTFGGRRIRPTREPSLLSTRSRQPRKRFPSTTRKSQQKPPTLTIPQEDL